MPGMWSVRHTHAANSCTAGFPILFGGEKHWQDTPTLHNNKISNQALGVWGICCLDQFEIGEPGTVLSR